MENWGVANARLTGTIYYQSYGTLLAQNYGGAVGGNKMFGGAILSIRVGDTGPSCWPERTAMKHSVGHATRLRPTVRDL